MNESPNISAGIDTSVTGVPDPQPIYIGPCGHEMFGMLHPPAGTARGTAVLICPPFGNSDNGSYMPRRTWAQRLAAAGNPALRIDLPGGGDSPGSPHDAGLLDRWVAAVAAAAAWLSATYHLRTAAIGLGLSGLVVCEAADRGAPLDDLVLWAVPSRGRRFLRELRIFEAMLAARVYVAEDGSTTSAPMPTEAREDGSLESAGFVLSAESVARIGAIDLAQLTPGAGAGRRVLLLDRDGIEVEERLTKTLGDWGAQVQSAPGPGFWRMMAAPYESLAPTEVMDSVDAWFAAAPGPSGPATDGDRYAESRDEIEIISEDGTVRERPLVVEHAAGRILAIVTEPLGDYDPRLTLVFVNSGTLRRVGPNRMWVEVARRWAARGVTVVRFDLARESDLSPVMLGRFHPTHGRPGDMFWDHLDPSFPSRYAAVLDHLGRNGFAERFLVAGLSSGAYWSLDRLREDERVRGAVLINCPFLRWNERERVRADVRKLGSWQTWRRLLHGEIPTERILHAGRMIGGLVLRPRAVVPATAEVDEVDLLLGRLAAHNQQLTCAFTAGEPLSEALEERGRMAEIKASPNVVIEHLDSPLKAHVLESVTLQRYVHEVFDRAVEHALVLTGPREPRLAGDRESV